MNAALLIASRELRDKSRLFITALALAAIPFLVSVLPFVRHKGNPSVIAILGGMAAFSMAIGTAAVLGATAIGRELSENRLSFYFSRPISPVAIWIGKTAASLITSLVCFGIIAFPAMLYARSAWSQTWTVGSNSVVLLTVAGTIVLFFVMHAASSMARSRSALVALDFALIITAGIAVAMILRPLNWAHATELRNAVAAGIGIASLIVFAVAPVRQLAAGRTDRKRSHVALSKVLWPAIAVVLLLAAAFVAWIVMASPSDLTGEVSAAQSPATGWMVVSGRPQLRGDYYASFLIDPKGESRRMGPLWWGADFSRDGRTLAFAKPIDSPGNRNYELSTLDLIRDEAEPVATGITFSSGDFVLSDDGRRLALREDENLSIHDLKEKKLLFSGRVFGDNTNANMYFVSNDLVRVIQWPHTVRKQKVTALISEVDVVRKTQTKTGEFGPVDYPYVVASEDGSRFVLRREGLLVDGRTGATLASYGAIGGSPMVLRDGTVVLPSPLTAPAKVTILRPNAAPVTVALPGMKYTLIRGEIAPGKLAVQAGETWEAKNRAQRTHIFVIGLASGRIDRVHRNMRGPLLAWNTMDPRPLAIDTGRPLPVYDENGKLAMWNPRTGEKTPTGIGQ